MATTAQIGTVIRILINDLIVDTNIRKNVKVPPAFASSVKQHGVLEPVDGYQDDNGAWHLQDGQLRYLAALAAGHTDIAVLVQDPALADAVKLTKQLVKNELRNEITDADRTAAYQTLFELGMSADQIQRKTNAPKKRVEASLKVAGSQFATELLAGSNPVTLDQAAVIAELAEASPEAAEKLAQVAIDQPAQFEHRAEDIRQQVEADAAYAIAAQEVLDAGYTVMDRGIWVSNRFVILEVDQLWIDKELTTPLELDHALPETAKTPGLVVQLSLDWVAGEDEEAEEVMAWTRNYFIEGWAGLGYFSKSWNYPSSPQSRADKTDEQIEADSADRKRVIRNNKAWPTATKVRMDWIGNTLLAGSKLPSDVQKFVALQRFSLFPRNSYGSGGEQALTWLNVPASNWSEKRVLNFITSRPDQAERLGLAYSIALVESEISDKSSWRRAENDSGNTARYLAHLQSWGYGLSDLEQEIVNTETKKLADQAAKAAQAALDAETTEPEDQ